MAILTSCIRRPTNPVPRSFTPVDGERYKVRDGDSWVALAQQASAAASASVDPWGLIRYNFPGLPADTHAASMEVNWYLQEYVGCKLLTPERDNYVFSSSASPGIIYLPRVSSYRPEAPILTGIKDRREAIMANTPGVFVVADDPSVKPYAEPWYSAKRFEEVTANSSVIERAAYQENLDPDFVRAIVWMETTHGYYDRIDPWNKTLRPMNVHAKLWSNLGVSRVALKDAYLNVAAGTHILSQIWERTKDPTPEKVATLYNQLGAERVNGYGKTIALYMTQKPWLLR
jgi:hypothetical protein